MENQPSYDDLANKLINIEDKIIEIESIVKVLNIWVKDNCYELIPLLNILNEKVNSTLNIIKK